MYDINAKAFVVKDSERILWKDGRSLYYATPRDQRPEIENPQDIEDLYHIYYQLDNAGADKEMLKKLKSIADLYIEYADNVLASLVEGDNNG